jgi:MFS family permease
MFKNNRRILVYVFLFSAVSINYIDRIALSVAAKPIASAYKLSPVEMGYLFSAFLWTYALAATPWGLSVDRLGSKVASAIGMLWWSAPTVATALFGHGFASILGTRLAMGLGESSTYPAGERVLREVLAGKIAIINHAIKRTTVGPDQRASAVCGGIGDHAGDGSLQLRLFHRP